MKINVAGCSGKHKILIDSEIEPSDSRQRNDAADLLRVLTTCVPAGTYDILTDLIQDRDRRHAENLSKPIMDDYLHVDEFLELYFEERQWELIRK